jgi:hypothetical protein
MAVTAARAPGRPIWLAAHQAAIEKRWAAGNGKDDQQNGETGQTAHERIVLKNSRFLIPNSF